MADMFRALDFLDDIQSLEYLEACERRKRTIHPDRINDLDCMDNEAFRSRYRLNKDTAEALIRMLDEKLSSSRTDKNNALTTAEKVLIALRFYATGSFQIVLGDLAHVSQSSASRALVSKALASLREEYIRLPETAGAELRQVSQEFYMKSGFPAVYGAIDCTHIPIINPGGELAEVFRCRKGYFSLNVQTVSDASLAIRDIVACWPGSTHDSTIFDNSHLRAVLETEMPPEYHLVGDSGYGCRSYLLTPFLDPATPQQVRYNIAHKAARNVVERQYGVMKRRFACLDAVLRCNLNNAMAIIVAVAVLHNIALRMDDFFDDVEEDNDDSSGFVPVNHAAGTAKRNALLSTFFNN